MMGLRLWWASRLSVRNFVGCKRKPVGASRILGGFRLPGLGSVGCSSVRGSRSFRVSVAPCGPGAPLFPRCGGGLFLSLVPSEPVVQSAAFANPT